MGRLSPPPPHSLEGQARRGTPPGGVPKPVRHRSRFHTTAPREEADAPCHQVFNKVAGWLGARNLTRNSTDVDALITRLSEIRKTRHGRSDQLLPCSRLPPQDRNPGPRLALLGVDRAQRNHLPIEIAQHPSGADPDRSSIVRYLVRVHLVAPFELTGMIRLHGHVMLAWPELRGVGWSASGPLTRWVNAGFNPACR